MNLYKKNLIRFYGIILLALLVGLISYPKIVSKIPPVYNFLSQMKINLGLDLQGGIHLEYEADISKIDSEKVDEAMQALQDVIERRVNAFGISEPVIYSTKSESGRRLIVELAGVKDIAQAKSMIKETPFLEFKEVGEPDNENQIPEDLLNQLNEQAKKKAEDILTKALSGEDFNSLAKESSEDPGSKDEGGDLGFVKKGSFVPEFDKILFEEDLKDGEVQQQLVETQFGWHIIKKIEQKGEGEDLEIHSAHILIAKKANPEPEVNYISTGLSGKNLDNASVEFRSQGLSEPEVAIKFDSEGTKLFAELTKKNIGKPIAIFLDEQIISAPTVQTEITNGEAVITGNFSTEEAKDLVHRLNQGALPVPINLVSQQSVEATLGASSLQKSLKAGMIGLFLIIVFMIVYYRFLGVISAIALLIYAGLMVSVFKLSLFSPWAITLTLPGIAGFILSIGMAVDANILIFERTKEEIKNGRSIVGSIEEGFKRAWTSIFDSNMSSILTAFILVIIGTGFVKGFAVTLIVGILLSMFTAIIVSRTLLRFFAGEWMEKYPWILGISRKEIKNQ
ncbi:MAG: protein translocase subunit SecD [Candidatus Moranbacteria bacterium CG10_big_fil_rev_8_21_14_0_10_35_21]|nr:MAG: protein translocase subunit SecD [Candidatus Moranbacteria bacterium CG10_big_fil_rev_8_21_14_0_10_35_21]PJA88685.1 MAG: protein translocase subunit SecD [Candidatus Moranbacteria bacterium CG_4_9_14_3_um_filter_36_9]